MTKVTVNNFEYTFTDSDIVNIDDWEHSGPEFSGEGYRSKIYLIHNGWFTVCVVFASNEQDAFDIACDENKLDTWMIDLENPDDRADYLTDIFPDNGGDIDCPDWVDETGKPFWFSIEPARLGNASEPFDLDTFDIIELPNPGLSFEACFVKKFGETGKGKSWRNPR